MATASTLALTPQDTGAFSSAPLDQASATQANELLQHNHEQYHIYSNDRGFHNHLAHHILALYAFNASPAILKRHYDANNSYQQPIKAVDPEASKNLDDPAKFKQYVSKREHYHDYLVLFEAEIAKLGVKGTLDKYLFGEDERSQDMLDRLFAGILHPLIHLGYGLEWSQPAIVAEALAQTATHPNWPQEVYSPAEKRIASGAPARKTLVALLHEANATPFFKKSVNFDDDLRVRDGAVRRGGQATVDWVSQWSVQASDSLEAKLTELSNFTAGMVGASQRVGLPPRIDFTLMHCANAVVLVAGIVRSPDVSDPAKRHVLQRTGQYALLTYLGQGSPVLQLEHMRNYQPAQGKLDGWQSLTARSMAVEDDGHVIKLLRALRFGEDAQRRMGEQKDELMGKDDWVRVGNMLLEAAERSSDDRFARGAGFDEAWV